MPYYMHELSTEYNPAIGKARHMSTEELKQVLNDDEKLENMIKELYQVQRNESEREVLITSNQSLAQFNLSQEPTIKDLRNKLEAYYSQLLVVKESVEDKKQKLDAILQQVSLDTTLALLQTAAAESEEESEATSEKFLSGEIPVDIFLEEYSKKRKEAHLRRIKAEKMSELLNNLNRGQNLTIGNDEGNHSTQSNHYACPYPTTSFLPYPVSFPPRM